MVSVCGARFPFQDRRLRFGMIKQGLPSDEWIKRFYDWSISEGLTV